VLLVTDHVDGRTRVDAREGLEEGEGEDQVPQATDAPDQDPRGPWIVDRGSWTLTTQTGQGWHDADRSTRNLVTKLLRYTGLLKPGCTLR